MAYVLSGAPGTRPCTSTGPGVHFPPVQAYGGIRLRRREGAILIQANNQMAYDIASNFVLPGGLGWGQRIRVWLPEGYRSFSVCRGAT